MQPRRDRVVGITLERAQDVRALGRALAGRSLGPADKRDPHDPGPSGRESDQARSF
jgi:hypothetical protein